jgi:hypothetical protein
MQGLLFFVGVIGTSVLLTFLYILVDNYFKRLND